LWQLVLVLLAIIRGGFPCPNKSEWFEAALTERREIHWLAHIIKRHAYRVNGNQVFSITSSLHNMESIEWSAIKPQIRYDCIVIGKTRIGGSETLIDSNSPFPIVRLDDRPILTPVK